MRLAIAAIGRLKDTGEAELASRYVKRIEAAGRALALGPVSVTELAEARAADVALRKSDEAGRLSAASSRAERRIILDERGQPLSSAKFAAWLADARDQGCREAAFLIGGPDGHDDSLRRDAQLILSMSAMTLPHGLARVVLLEQIYRAITIIGGHPYHRA